MTVIITKKIRVVWFIRVFEAYNFITFVTTSKVAIDCQRVQAINVKYPVNIKEPMTSVLGECNCYNFSYRLCQIICSMKQE